MLGPLSFALTPLTFCTGVVDPPPPTPICASGDRWGPPALPFSFLPNKNAMTELLQREDCDESALGTALGHSVYAAQADEADEADDDEDKIIANEGEMRRLAEDGEWSRGFRSGGEDAAVRRASSSAPARSARHRRSTIDFERGATSNALSGGAVVAVSPVRVRSRTVIEAGRGGGLSAGAHWIFFGPCFFRNPFLICC